MTIQHLFPTAKPTLNLNFAGERSLDPRITFSRSSIGTYVDEDGIIRYAAEDEPRFEYDGATGESLGLLIEEFRTNTVLHSGDLTASSWTAPVNSSWSAGDIAPDGVTTSNRLTEDLFATDQEHSVSVAVANLSGGADPGIDITVSFWAKSSNRGIRARALAWANWNFYFDIANVSGNRDAQIASGNLIPFPNGWYKCVYTGNVQGNRRFSLQMFDTATTAGNVTYPGDGSSYVDLFGVQTEAGSFSTSYIPTNGAEVDRELDLCEILETNFSSWFNNPAGTFSLEARTIINGPNWFFGTGLVTIANEQQINMYQGDSATTGSRRLATGMANASVIELTENVTDSFKAAAGYEYSIGRSASYNGGTAIASNVSNITPNYLTIGSRTRPISGGKKWLGGQSWIARLAYYPRRLSDEQLEALTS